MKALFCEKPGSFAYRTIQKPAPAEGRAIIRIRRIGICGTDLHAFEGTQPFFNFPRILGHELAGELEDTGGAESFSEGEMVTFIPYFNCGTCIACRSGKPNCCTSISVCGVHADGGMAEWLSVPAYALVHGNGLSADELALVEPLAIGAHAIRRADVRPGEYVLVVGAGPIGLGIAAFARIAGGIPILLDLNASRLQFASEKLKIDLTVNGKMENAHERIREITAGDMPTVVIDATGNLHAINNSFQYMSHGARYVLVGLQKEAIAFSHPEFHKREGTLMSSRNATRQDFEHVIASMKQGLVDPAGFITHRVQFDDVASKFASWLDPATNVVKAMVAID